MTREPVQYLSKVKIVRQSPAIHYHWPLSAILEPWYCLLCSSCGASKIPEPLVSRVEEIGKPAGLRRPGKVANGSAIFHTSQINYTTAIYPLSAVSKAAYNRDVDISEKVLS
jgi:hypothetical protein